MRGKLLISTAITGLVVLAGTVVTMAQEATPTPTATATATATATPTVTTTPVPTATPAPTSLRRKDKALADEIARILGLDPAQVEATVAKARLNLASQAVEVAIKARLDAFVRNGKLTQADADAIFLWIQARPAAADRLLGNLKDKSFNTDRHLEDKHQHEDDHDNEDDDDDDDDDRDEQRVKSQQRSSNSGKGNSRGRD